MAARNRGVNKPKLRDLSRQWPTDAEQAAAFQEVVENRATPITVAVLGTSLIEFELEKILRNKFPRKDDDTWSDVTSLDGPLSGLNAKIVAGYAFGLYGEVFEGALHTLRNIRNAFAHSKKLIDFENELVLKELRKLKNIDKSKPQRSRLSKGLRDVAWIASAPEPNGRLAFVVFIYVLSNYFLRYTNKILKRKSNSSGKRLVAMERLSPIGIGWHPVSVPKLSQRGLLVDHAGDSNPQTPSPKPAGSRK